MCAMVAQSLLSAVARVRAEVMPRSARAPRRCFISNTDRRGQAEQEVDQTQNLEIASRASKENRASALFLSTQVFRLKVSRKKLAGERCLIYIIYTIYIIISYRPVIRKPQSATCTFILRASEQE
jgi:hypothetical protein